ncbi:MAG: hypothetical protein HY326_11430 [Chloroflexi bacterium]|nr:hypothetical protein [Chloroflexota bacterium]
MKKLDIETSETEEEFVLSLHPRPARTVSLKIPEDAWSALEKIAHSRDMSPEALLKLYIGEKLRQDVARRFGDRVLEKTAEVLARHPQSEAEFSAILQEIRDEATS